MLKVQNKTTNKIRVAQIVLFLIQLVLTSTPFVWGTMIDLTKNKSTYTVLDMITLIGCDSGNADNDRMLTILGLCFLAFIILPLVAVMFQIFDKSYNLKNIVGLICSGLGVICIVYFIGNWICIGAVVAILLYLLSFFLSVMGIFARYLKTDNKANNA